MPEAVSRLLQRVKEFWNNLEKSQKNRLYITSGIVLVAFIAAMFLLTKPNHVVLVSNVEERDVKEMIDVLNESSIWNAVGEDGQSILVNFKDKGAAKMALAGSNFPKNGFTFEDAIKKIGISTTESDKKQIWNEKRKSDIESMLKSNDNIEDAEVILALPEKDYFLIGDDQQKPTAHVTIKPRSNLTIENIQAIQMAVSRSVEGLDPNDITIVDNNLNLLNANTQNDSMAMATSQEKMRVDKENRLQTKVYDSFRGGQFVNFDSLRVVANVVLDFDKKKVQTKNYAIPEGMEDGAAISERHFKEDLENGTVGGEPGVGTNPGTVDSPTYQTANQDASKYTKKEDEVNRVYNEEITELELATGDVVKAESSLAITLWYGRSVQDDSGLTEDFITSIKETASTATGIPLKNIAISMLKLTPPEPVVIQTTDMIKQLINDYGFFAIVLLLVIGLMIATLPKRKRLEEFEDEEAEDLQPAMASGPKFIIPEVSTNSIPEIGIEERSEVKKQIEKFVKQKPDAVAQLLRNWLSDDWDG